MKDLIKYNVDDNLYMRYWDNATDMWLGDGWTPLDHQNCTEAAYDIIIQKLICEQLMEASRKAGDEMTYTKTILMRGILEDVEARFVNMLSQRDRAAFLLLTVNLSSHHSGKCTALSLKNGALTSYNR